MSSPTTVTARTNTTRNSQTEVHCTCETLWAAAQDYSIVKLSAVRWENNRPIARMVRSYAVRARRIAGTYARFYLEQEAGGDPIKKGRFYWMALGAFASKTVACTLEHGSTRVLRALRFSTRLNMEFLETLRITNSGRLRVDTALWEGLAKGNFWLFLDISGWHWFYSRFPHCFDGCIDARDSRRFDAPIRGQMSVLPWNNTALQEVKYFNPSNYVKNGFALVKEIEDETDEANKKSLQLKHLLAIANHEQREILQPLIYDHGPFAWLLAQQREYPQLARFGPKLEIVFASACETDNPALSSVAPEGTRMEDVESRMKWINKVAEHFHELMINQTAYMERELQTIAGWHDMADR